MLTHIVKHLSHSVNFYFTDESEPSLVIEREHFFRFRYSVCGSTRPIDSPYATETEPDAYFIPHEIVSSTKSSRNRRIV